MKNLSLTLSALTILAASLASAAGPHGGSAKAQSNSLVYNGHAGLGSNMIAIEKVSGRTSQRNADWIKASVRNPSATASKRGSGVWQDDWLAPIAARGKAK